TDTHRHAVLCPAPRAHRPRYSFPTRRSSDLALGVKVWDTLGTGIARNRLEELWAHAVAVGVAAKTLTARLRVGDPDEAFTAGVRSEEHTSELQSPDHLVCRLLLEKKKKHTQE